MALVVGAPFLVGASIAPDRDGQVVFRFADPAIVESSGLVVEDGLVVTVNDSGDSARVFAVDLDTGRTVGVTTWDDEPLDVEALAPAGPGQVWVGDIGDNPRSRSSLSVTRVPVGRTDQSVPGDRFELTHTGGAADAEALLAHPRTGRLYVVTKGMLSGSILAAPASLSPDGPNRLREVGQAPGLVTDGAFFSDGRHLLLRNYNSATVLTFPGLETVGSFGLPRQQQGEGIAVAPDGRIYASSEGARSPLLRISLPEDVERAMARPGSDESSERSSESPSELPSDSPSPEAGSSGTGTDSGTDSGTDTGAGTGAGTGTADPDVWPWLLGGLLGAVAIGVLIRSLRPR